MLNSKEIRNVKFSKAMGGYKQEEVDILLDKIEADYDQFERAIREMSAKIDSLNGQIEEYKNSQGSIQNVLVQAQKLADSIVEDAKSKSAEIITSAQHSIENITEQEKELSAAFERKAEERKALAEAEYEKAIEKCKEKQAAIEKATADSVARQQALYNKLKLEIVAFKTEITAKYKEHLELLSVIPDTVPMDPKDMAEAVSIAFDKAPEPESFLNLRTSSVAVEDFLSDEEPSGFVINAEEDFTTEEE